MVVSLKIKRRPLVRYTDGLSKLEKDKLVLRNVAILSLSTPNLFLKLIHMKMDFQALE